MVTFKHKGDFKKTTRFFGLVIRREYLKDLDKFGRRGVAALSAATPIDSGKTAESWNYEIRNSGGSISIYWTNSNINDGVPIAVILQYGHGTRNGGYVQGRDYINPAIRPVFDNIADSAWKELIKE